MRHFDNDALHGASRKISYTPLNSVGKSIPSYIYRKNPIPPKLQEKNYTPMNHYLFKGVKIHGWAVIEIFTIFRTAIKGGGLIGIFTWE